MDVSFENDSTQSGGNYAALGIRQQGGPDSHGIKGTPYSLKFWFNGAWQLLVDGVGVATGNVVTGSGGVTIPDFDTDHDAWHRLALQALGSEVTASLDGVTLATFTEGTRALRRAGAWPRTI